MWPFKKRKASLAPKESKIIICITGNWSDLEDFKDSVIVTSEARYMVAGGILMNGKDQRHYSIEFCERDERMQESFRIAGKVTEITEDVLAEIDRHKYVIYITGEIGGMEEAGHIAYAGAAILNAGGTALKVESTGKAFSKTQWLDFMDDFETHRLYEMFVLDSIIDEDGTIFSCGMQNLGLRDTIVSDEDFPDAIELIRIFGYYQIVDKPDIRNNQTFQKDTASPLFRITNEIFPPYEKHDTFRNPFGMWRLTKENQ